MSGNAAVPDLFGIDIAGEIGEAFDGQLVPATLTKVTPGQRTESTGGTNPTSKPYPCQGIIEHYVGRQIDGTRIRANDRRILLIANSLPAGIVPAHGDRVTIEGSTWNVVTLEDRDPAGATYVVQAR